MSSSRTRGTIVASDGFAVGSKGSEAGLTAPVTVALAASSAAQTVYTIAPVTGTIESVYVVSNVASTGATYTVKAGSAGDTLASLTLSSAGIVAGSVSAMTLGTVAVVAGQGISVARGTQGTAGAAQVAISIKQTA